MRSVLPHNMNKDVEMLILAYPGVEALPDEQNREPLCLLGKY